jgi:uracil-DNA glycosylase family 4
LRLQCELKWNNCEACGLSKTRSQVVIGSGDPKAKLMLVGEAPGESEDVNGVPFWGKAGELLTDMLVGIGVTRDEVFLDNVVACRPFVKDEEAGTERNRTPNSEEIGACLPRLLEAIYELDPILIIALGDTAFKALTKNASTITKARGGMFEAKFLLPGKITEVSYSVKATFHPSYLQRNRGEKNKPGSIWEHTYRDVMQAVEMVDIARNRYYGVRVPTR